MLSVSAAAVIILPASPAECGCVTPPTCNELGFTMTSSDCSGFSLKCPFDTNKVYCTKAVVAADGVNPDGTVNIAGKRYSVQNGSMGGISHISAVNGCSNKGTGWRLPTTTELEVIISLRDSISATLSVSADTSGSGFLWSSTQCGSTSYIARYIGSSSCKAETKPANVSICVKEL